MRYATILILGIAAGVAGYAAVIHLLVGLVRRSRDQTHLLFALLSLSITSHTFAVLLRLSFDLFNLALFSYFFYALVRQYRGAHRRRALSRAA